MKAKKLISCLLTGAMVLSMVACGSEPASNESQPQQSAVKESSEAPASSEAQTQDETKEMTLEELVAAAQEEASVDGAGSFMVYAPTSRIEKALKAFTEEYGIQGEYYNESGQDLYTKLTTVDNREVLIPNGSLANGTMVNVSANPTRRVDIAVGVSYSADLKLAQKILRDLGEKDAARLADQDVTVFVSELGASSVNLGLRVWVDAANYWDCKWRLTENIKAEFDKAGIEIPFNQLDVHMK